MQQQINLFDIWDLQFPFSFLLFVILFIKSFITFKCFVVKWYCFTLNEYKRISLEYINNIEPDICVVISWGWMLNRKLAQWIFLKWARCCSRTMQAPTPALYIQQSFYYFPISAGELVLSDRGSLLNTPSCTMHNSRYWYLPSNLSNYWIGCAILSILSPLIPLPPVSTFQSFYSDFNNFVLKRPGPTRKNYLQRGNEECIEFDMNDPARFSLHEWILCTIISTCLDVSIWC